MTALELILIIILWISYGLFAAFRSEDAVTNEDKIAVVTVVYVIFAPIVFIIKCLYGAFKQYK